MSSPSQPYYQSHFASEMRKMQNEPAKQPVVDEQYEKVRENIITSCTEQ